MSDSGLVIVAKPAGMTSHDVVARMRKVAGTRRVGHAGTLDPMATGVLIIGIDKATRLLGHLALTEKEYRATIRLGQSTVTDDAEGDILPPAADAVTASSISAERLRSALAELTGEIQQVPPKISAIKVKGQRAYHLTRSGAAPELVARKVTVWRLDLLAVRPVGELLDLDVEITCSSGTYIRAIARDLGAALGTGGHLTALSRTRVGPYRLESARSLEELAEHLELIPLADAAATAFPSLHLSAEEARLLAHGVRLPAGIRAAASDHADCVAHDSAGAVSVGAVLAGAASDGAVSDGAASDGAASDGAVSDGAVPAEVPMAAFGPDGTLIALVTERDAELHSLAVFLP